ncbi:MAG: transposase, partial [Coprobacillus sp.]
NAREELAHIIQLYINSNIEGYRSFASSTLLKWFEEIVNSFSIVDGRRISNGPIESTNSRVKTILKVANGFKNFSRMRNKIMYCLNKDALITVTKQLQQIKRKGKARGKYNKK